MSVVAALCVSGVAVIADIVATAVPYWLHESISGYITANVGLWTSCGSALGQTVCMAIPVVPDFMKATRALEIIGIVLLAIAVGLGLMKQIKMKENFVLPKVAGVCALLSGMSTIVGAIIFAAKFDQSGAFKAGLSLHAGFGLAIVGGIMAIVGGSLFFVANRMLPGPFNFNRF